MANNKIYHMCHSINNIRSNRCALILCVARVSFTCVLNEKEKRLYLPWNELKPLCTSIPPVTCLMLQT